MKQLPSGLAAYNRTRIFSEDTIPATLLKEHRTKPDVWAVINVFEGKLALTFNDSGVTRTLTPDNCGVVEPEQLHYVTALGSVSFQIEFYR